MVGRRERKLLCPRRPGRGAQLSEESQGPLTHSHFPFPLCLSPNPARLGPMTWLALQARQQAPLVEEAQSVGPSPSSVANWPSPVPPAGPIGVEVLPAHLRATVLSGPTAQPAAGAGAGSSGDPELGPQALTQACSFLSSAAQRRRRSQWAPGPCRAAASLAGWGGHGCANGRCTSSS